MAVLRGITTDLVSWQSCQYPYWHLVFVESNFSDCVSRMSSLKLHTFEATVRYMTFHKFCCSYIIWMVLYMVGEMWSKYHVIFRRKRVTGADINNWANWAVGSPFQNVGVFYLELTPVSSLDLIVHHNKWNQLFARTQVILINVFECLLKIMVL